MYSKPLGVTLIELLITMAVLAVIAGIAIPLYTGYISSARNTEGWNNLSGIRLAQEEFFLDNNIYFSGASSDGSLGTYYTVPEGADRNFEYSVTGTATTWSASATGRGSGYDVPSSVTFSMAK